MTDERIEEVTRETYDVAIAGGGFGGLVAAATASERGLRVLLFEAAERVGGTLALSSGLMHMYDPPSWEAYRKAFPTVDEELGRALYDRFPDLVKWLSGTVHVSLAQTPLPADPYGDKNRVPVGHLLGVSPRVYDMRAGLGRLSAIGYKVLGDTYLKGLDLVLLRRMRLDVVRRIWSVAESRSAKLVTRARVKDVERAGDQFTIKATTPDGDITVKARSVILACGGFQGGRDDLKEHLGAGGEHVICRAALTNVGDGLAIGKRLGADVRGPMDRFYGYPMPEMPKPIDHETEPLALLTCSAFYASSSVLVNAKGERFVDEAAAGKIAAIGSSIATKANGVAWSIIDEKLHQKFAVRDFAGGLLSKVDLLASAKRRGATIVSVDRLEDLPAALAKEGLDEATLRKTLDAYQEVAKNGGKLDPPRSGKPEPLTEPPFVAVKLVPGVSMTYGGLRIDAKARLVDRSGAPLPGLFAVPGVAGGLYTEQYGGALAACGTFGRIAGENACG
jgi:succinate dehydrogenase/fumarate reductase flavoprotein subunit